MAGAVSALPKFQFASAAGVPLANGTLEVYIAGSTTHANTYQDAALTTLNTWPITLDAAGECLMWLDDSKLYKFILKNAAGAQQWSVDNVPAGAGPVFKLSATGAASRSIASKLSDFLCVQDFTGVDATGATDSYAGVTAAITAAALTGRAVYFPAGTYKIATTLAIPAGVRLFGEGHGATALTAPTTGAILSYTGTSDAVRINGSVAGMEHIAVVGTVSATGAGVLVNGNGNVVESWFLHHVTVYGFTGGTGVKLYGVNSGVVAYGEVIDLRIRNAKVGIHINDTGGASGFANTNQFFGGAINGGGFDYAIRVQGGNDNRFWGMSVEPSSSTVGHIVVETGWITFDGRLEGSSQSSSVPLIDVWNTAGATTINGLGASGLVKNQGNALLGMTGGKHAEPVRPSENRFANPGFGGVDTSARTITGWTVTETGGASTWTLDTSVIVPGYQTIKIDVPAGGNVELKPTVVPALPDNSLRNVVFGLWVKTTTAQSAFARINAPAGVTSSGLHSGSGSWEAISMAQAFSATLSADPRFELPGGAGGATFYVTAPYFTYGYAQPRNSAHLTTNGGVLYGTLEGGACTISLPAAGDNAVYTTATAEVTAPKWGNVIHIAGTARTITRLNNVLANRMSTGTIVRLVFDIGGVGVTDGGPGFIDLTAAFTSAVPATTSGRSWLLLESNGDGTWYELDRR